MSTYSLDAERFINEIKKHRQLWDVDENGRKYKNSEKEKAWCAVARVFIEDFDSLSGLEQDEVHRKLYNKWRNIRDTYVRNIRSTRVNKNSNYVFMKQLSFLDCRYKNDHCNNRSNNCSNSQSSDDDKSKNENSCDSDEPSIIENLKRKRASIRKKKIKIAKTHGGLSKESVENDEKQPTQKPWQSIEIIDPAMQYSEFENQNPIATSRMNEEVSADVSVPFDEDRSFFDSLLPAVREFDMDQKLKFRFEVLKTIKDIRASNQGRCKPEPSSAY